MTARDLFGQIDSIKIDGRDAYFDEQHPEYVPIPNEKALEDIDQVDWLAHRINGDPSEIVGKTNRELDREFGISVFGSYGPEDPVVDERIDGGKLSPTADMHQAWLDAEDGSLEYPWSVDSSDDAANQKCITNHAAESDDPDESALATFNFEVKEGIHIIYSRIRTSQLGSHIWFRIDDGEWRRRNIHYQASRGFRWCRLMDPEVAGEAQELKLSGGEHTIQLAYAKPETNIDSIYITNNERPPVGMKER
jgi:hypothetical protein